jgi:hypothetical protein
LLHPPPIGVTISIASPASTLASAQPDRVSMLPSLRRTELRPGPTPACAQTWDNAGPASMSPRSAGKGTDGIAYWIRRYFIVSNFARWLSIASLPATSLPLFATVRLEVTVDRYQPENPEPFSGRASVVPRETKIALNACAPATLTCYGPQGAGQRSCWQIGSWLRRFGSMSARFLSALSIAIGGNAILRRLSGIPRRFSRRPTIRFRQRL